MIAESAHPNENLVIRINCEGNDHQGLTKNINKTKSESESENEKENIDESENYNIKNDNKTTVRRHFA